MKSILIRDTTRQEREEIVRQSLSWCGGGCENCSSCWLGGGKAEDIYQPYIDGEKEISEINQEYHRPATSTELSEGGVRQNRSSACQS
ncbi:hypothetical protein [Porcincola intestinalis]|uniref:hypothetical protein n=1 Tax=Porcincola intestinalis TaxID=2606632 RepID=UPI002A807230|nr:hypothetical protein [Porcincola intestinalis]MDY4204307.1 hypothetical protein [Porcincola intestinalis]